MFRGQVEFIVLLGVVAIIAVVAVFLLSTSTIYPTNIPSSIASQQRIVEDHIINTGRLGAGLGIKWVEMQGGQLEPPNDSVVFDLVSVRYWQKCSDTSMMPTIEEITNRLESGVERYMYAALNETRDFFGKNTSIDVDSISVDANILPHKIDFTVFLPTTIEGYPIQQPYEFSVPTNLGEIYEFASAFARENADKRFIEHYTINSIYFSNEVETQGVLTECGEAIHHTGSQISRGLENSVVYTLANTVWWQPMQPATDTAKTYSIESLEGRKYPQLDIGFWLPDGFRMGPASPLFISNNQYIASGLMWVVPTCFAIYDWKYSMDFPVVLRVRDDLTGNSMNFAIHAHIDDMVPGDCGGMNPGGGGDVNLGCMGRIRVLDTSGRPVSGASASYAGFLFGVSGPDGYIENDITCDPGELVVGKEGFGHIKHASSPQTINGTYVLSEKANLTFNFKKVAIDTENVFSEDYKDIGLGNLYHICTVGDVGQEYVVMNVSSDLDYYVTNINPNEVDGGCIDSDQCRECQATNDQSSCIQCGSTCLSSTINPAEANYIPGGDYRVITDMWDTTNFRIAGTFDSDLENIPETDTEFFVNIPIKSYNYVTNSRRSEATNLLKNSCDIDPFSTEEYGNRVKMLKSCSCNRMRKLVRNGFPNCIDTAQEEAMFDCKEGEDFWNCIDFDCNTTQIIDYVENQCGYEVLGC